MRYTYGPNTGRIAAMTPPELTTIPECVDSIEQAISKVLPIDIQDLYEDDRSEPVATARLLFYYMLHYHGKMRKIDIAALIQRDHTTVLYGISKIDQIVVAKQPQAMVDLVHQTELFLEGIRDRLRDCDGER